jgi:hypothetical protein
LAGRAGCKRLPHGIFNQSPETSPARVRPAPANHRPLSASFQQIFSPIEKNKCKKLPFGTTQITRFLPFQNQTSGKNGYKNNVFSIMSDQNSLFGCRLFFDNYIHRSVILIVHLKSEMLRLRGEMAFPISENTAAANSPNASLGPCSRLPKTSARDTRGRARQGPSFNPPRASSGEAHGSASPFPGGRIWPAFPEISRPPTQ